MAPLAGALGVLGFAPYNYWIFGLISLAGLLCCLHKHTVLKRSLLVGWLWGIGFFGFGISWIAISLEKFTELTMVVRYVVMGTLVLVLAGYPALFSVLLTWARRRFTPPAFLALLLVPILWHSVELGRTHFFMGFPWLQMGYTQTSGPLSGLAPVIGVEGITFTLLLLATLIASGIKKRSFMQTFLYPVLIVTSLIPLKRINWVRTDTNCPVPVALVQGNISQDKKWDATGSNKILFDYYALSLPYLKCAYSIFWPETAIPLHEWNQRDFLHIMDKACRAGNSVLLTGLIDQLPHAVGTYYNAIVALGSEQPYYYGNPNRYYKHHLVPFGEFTPLAGLLTRLERGLNLPLTHTSAGPLYQPALKIKAHYFVPAICYEVIFGEELRKRFIQQGQEADFLVTVSNDTWFGHSKGPWQHLQIAQMRALELGRTLVRATNSGVTAIVSEKGQLLKTLPLFVEDVLEYEIFPSAGITPYARFGSKPLNFFTGLTFLIVVFIRSPLYRYNTLNRARAGAIRAPLN